MTTLVTDEMRKAVSEALVYEVNLLGKPNTSFPVSDALTRLIHHELTRDEDPRTPRTSMAEFASLLIDDRCEEEAIIHEYVLLLPYLGNGYNTLTYTMLIRGLHRHARNREWMDPNDSASLRRNAVLLRSIVLLRAKANEKLLDEALEDDYSFRHSECIDLILDHPQHHELLINFLVERGYQNGMAAFREAIANDAPALSAGVL